MKKIGLLILLLITACVKSPEKRSLLERSNCDLPCWNRIVAGQTTQDDLLKILRSLPDIDQESVRFTNKPWNIFENQFYFVFRQGWALGQKPELRGEGSIKNNKVSDLILCGKLDTVMGEIVEQIGEPESLISGNNFYGGRTVILINSQKGVSYWYTTELDNLEIQTDTLIDCVKVFDPTFYEAMLEAKLFSNGYYDAKETLKVMYPWDGYGNLDEKYPPRQP